MGEPQEPPVKRIFPVHPPILLLLLQPAVHASILTPQPTPVNHPAVQDKPAQEENVFPPSTPAPIPQPAWLPALLKTRQPVLLPTEEKPVLILQIAITDAIFSHAIFPVFRIPNANRDTVTRRQEHAAIPTAPVPQLVPVLPNHAMTSVPQTASVYPVSVIPHREDAGLHPVPHRQPAPVRLPLLLFFPFLPSVLPSSASILIPQPIPASHPVLWDKPANPGHANLPLPAMAPVPLIPIAYPAIPVLQPEGILPRYAGNHPVRLMQPVPVGHNVLPLLLVPH